MFQTLVLPAKALIILYGTKNFCAKQPVALRLERTVIDGFRLLHLTIGPGTYFLGRSQTDLDRIELFFLGNLFE